MVSGEVKIAIILLWTKSDVKNCRGRRMSLISLWSLILRNGDEETKVKVQILQFQQLVLFLCKDTNIHTVHHTTFFEVFRDFLRVHLLLKHLLAKG